MLQCDAMPERRRLRDPDGVGVHAGLHEHRPALGVLEDELQRVARQPRVDGHGNGPGPHRAEEDLQELAAVADDHADPLSGSHTKAPHQPSDTIGAFVKLRVGRSASRPPHRSMIATLSGKRSTLAEKK